MFRVRILSGGVIKSTDAAHLGDNAGISEMWSGSLQVPAIIDSARPLEMSVLVPKNRRNLQSTEESTMTAAAQLVCRKSQCVPFILTYTIVPNIVLSLC